MNRADYCDPEARSVAYGIGWPAIGSDAAVHLLGLLFQRERLRWLPPEQLLTHQLGQMQLLPRHAQSIVLTAPRPCLG